ncbi:hypothetical protein [Streptomyces sp. P9-A2]|uniref:hypothetical protein n=1 Tax=Streptomyces sp. P9-A2 TaxID=3072284 RepID=UPI002FCC3DA6
MPPPPDAATTESAVRGLPAAATATPAACGPPTAESLHRAVAAFLGLSADVGLDAGLDAGPGPDTDAPAPPARPTQAPPAPASYEPLAHDDPDAALRWLNSWGCRIRYPRPGEPDTFGPGLRAWASRWYARLPGPETRIGDLTDDAVAPLGACYADLAALRVGPPERPRALGATAASKLLHGLRPRTLVPWDEAIARKLHGARDAAAYTAHQRLNRDWARHVLADSGLDEEQLAVLYGCPGRPLAKMLDDYTYLTLTRSDIR